MDRSARITAAIADLESQYRPNIATTVVKKGKSHEKGRRSARTRDAVEEEAITRRGGSSTSEAA